QWVYNLWVEDIHTYAVGRSEILVHNNAEQCAEIVQVTLRGRSLFRGQGHEYAAFARKILAAAEEAPPGVLVERGPTNKMTKVIKQGGGVSADIDGFTHDIWYEMKVNLQNQDRLDLEGQLVRQLEVTTSYGKRLAIVSTTSTRDVPRWLADFCRTHNIDIVS